MKKILILILTLSMPLTAHAFLFDQGLGQKLKGYILLQVESYGRAWYVSPENYKRYYLDRPKNAFDLMRHFGVGITNEDLAKIPIGIIENTNTKCGDADEDGLSDNLEKAIGANPQSKDSDNDGYDDKIEIKNNYNPLGSGKLNIDETFSKKNTGKIFLQIEKQGQAWYVNPTDNKRYYLERPSDAFLIMKTLSLGITNKNISEINIGNIEDEQNQNNKPPQNNPPSNENNVISAAASAIRGNNTSQAAICFIPEMKKAIEYTMDFLSAKNRLVLGNILSSAKLTSSTENKKIYTAEVYWMNEKIPVEFNARKQNNGTWLLTNL